MGVKQTQAQAYLNNLNTQGITLTGQTRNLKIHALEPKNKVLEDSLLIKHKIEGGVEIKSQFTKEGKKTEKEKLLFLIGEACYAAAFNINEPNPEEVKTTEQKRDFFDNFMQELTKVVKTYHRLV